VEVVVIFTPRPLYLEGKILRYPLDRRLGGPQSLSVHCGEEKNPQPLTGLKLIIKEGIHVNEDKLITFS
jgi:hypothetical protein